MERYTPIERAAIVKMFIKNNSSIVQTQREFRRKYGRRAAPDAKTIRRLAARFEEYGTLADVRHRGRSRTSRSVENVDAVRRSVEQHPETSTRRRATQIGISRWSLRQILHKDLHMFPYKIQVVQQLLPRDHQQRREYAQAILNLNEQIANFDEKIIMSDETHFDLNGVINKQNTRFWGTDNPQNIHERPLHPERVTVWCGITAERVIGPYFFEDAAGNTITVNGQRYREMLEDFFKVGMEEQGPQNMWFQQDGATAHTARETIQILRRMFPGRLISRSGDVLWPARSPDLTAPDFFLWGFLKSKVYVNSPQTLEQLKENIRQEIANITPEILKNVMQNAIKRAQMCINENGRHLLDIIF